MSNMIDIKDKLDPHTSDTPFFPIASELELFDVSIGPGQTTVTLIPLW